MTRLNPAKLLTPLQWTLSVIAFESGLTQAGLSDTELTQPLHAAAGAGPGPGSWGLLQALVAMLVVVPSATGFLPRLAPLAAAGLALAFASTSAGLGPMIGFGSPLVTALLAIGFTAVAVGRGLVRPVTPLALGPETRDPWHLPSELVERRRRSMSGRPVQPLELAARRSAPVARPRSRSAA